MDKALINNYTSYVMNLLEVLPDSSFKEKILKSMLYRGIAMVGSFGVANQNIWLEQAEYYARNNAPSTIIESIVAKDNLYTLLQTLSKWNTSQKNLAAAEINLREMIAINPIDSTSHSELGFFLLNVEKFEEATSCFKNALEYGPPGVGMNAYYYAICLQKTDRIDEAISAFYKCISCDSSAISPWLDLLEHYINTHDHEQIKQISMQIHNSTILWDQLESEEREQIRTYIFTF